MSVCLSLCCLSTRTPACWSICLVVSVCLSTCPSAVFERLSVCVVVSFSICLLTCLNVFHKKLLHRPQLERFKNKYISRSAVTFSFIPAKRQRPNESQSWYIEKLWPISFHCSGENVMRTFLTTWVISWQSSGWRKLLMGNSNYLSARRGPRRVFALPWKECGAAFCMCNV